MIDGTREGEMDAAYMLRVDKAGNCDFCLVVIECMCRGDRDLKVSFIDQNAAVAWHDDGDCWGGRRLFNKLCLCGLAALAISSAQEGSSHHLFHHHITVRLAGAHLLSIWPYAPN
jgi:hypothetical protein